MVVKSERGRERRGGGGKRGGGGGGRREVAGELRYLKSN